MRRLVAFPVVVGAFWAGRVGLLGCGGAREEAVRPGEAAATGWKAPSSAEEVFARYVAETGGREAYGRLGPVEIRGRMAVEGRGVRLATRMVVAGERFRMTQEVPGGGFLEVGSDGRDVWVRDPVDGVALVVGEEADAARADALLAFELDWRRVFREAVFLGPTVFQGRRCFAVRMVPRFGPGEQVRYYDADTGLLYASVRKLPSAPAELWATFLYGDYRRVGGVLVPHLVVMEQAGDRFLTRIEEVRVGVEVEEDSFRVPDGDAGPR